MNRHAAMKAGVMRPNRSMPTAQIIPELVYPDVAAAAEWLCKAFGFSVRMRIANHRIQLSLGTGAIVLRTGALASGGCSAHSTMKPFKVGTVAWRLDNVAAHTKAGFAPVPDDLVRIHYFRYWQFLKAKNYLLKEIPADSHGWDGELWSTDLSIEGFRFIQYSHDRWAGRLHIFNDMPGDLAYLDWWHEKFKKLPKGTFEEYDA
jgi:hypothetical protein